jgi:hypothetical protein
MKKTLHFIGQRLTVNGKRGRTVHRFPFTVFLIALAIALAIAACKEDDENTQGNSKIDLLTPATTAQVRPDKLPLVFTWKTSDGVGPTTLYISTDETFPEGAKTFRHEAGQELTYSLNADEYDAILAAAGVGYTQLVTVHWKVAAANTSAASSFRAYRQARPSIALISDFAELDANATGPAPEFVWKTVPDVTAYTIKFSTVDKFPATTATKTYDADNSSSYTFGSWGDFDRMLEELGIVKLDTVYWTVAPTDPNAAVGTPPIPRRFIGKRITMLVTPYDAPMIVDGGPQAFTLEWVAQNGVSSYDVVVARDEALTDVVASLSQTGLNATSHSIPWATLQAMIENPTNNFKRYKKNVLYWNVKANGQPIEKAPGRVNLYGKRTFVDRRAEWIKATFTDYSNDALAVLEPLRTYKVTVIEYNNKEVVWLAEDLQATSNFHRTMTSTTEYANPTPMPPRVVAVYKTSKDPCTHEPLPDVFLHRGPTDPPIGIYYEDSYLDIPDATDGWTSVIPRTLINGDQTAYRTWRLPNKADWDELFTAAVAEFGDDKALRHPASLTSPPAHANAWGMNFVPNGFFEFEGCWDGHQKDKNGNNLDGIHMTWNMTDIYYHYSYTGADPHQAVYKWNGSAGSQTKGNGQNVRVIYIGDDNP